MPSCHVAMLKSGFMALKIQADSEVWRDWEKRFLLEEEEAYRQQTPAEPTEAVPAHDLMSTKEVCAKLQWSRSTLLRNIRARKLAYIKRDGRLMFRRADVERYDQKRYIREK